MQTSYFRKTLVIIVAVLALSSCVATETTRVAAVFKEIVKSPDDPRDYAYFVLPNALRVLVISDPETDKAGAALNVGVGSLHDPVGREGLAHFLEHMLFLGTEKYPAAGEYQNFINTHGGNHNAYTAAEDTNYFFGIDKDYLEPALDRFSQFFVAPLFNGEYVAREKNAVHSEYQSRLKDDKRRTYSVLQQITNPAHPASRFNVGSLETLADRGADTVLRELLAFYRKYYSPELMTLVIVGKEPATRLAAWAREKFADIEKRPASIPAVTDPLFVPGRLPVRLNIAPVSDQRTLMLTFPLPSVRHHTLTSPVNYIANLIGHEGQGSLLSSLKETNWADSLSAGLGFDNRDNAALSISIALTQQGLLKVDQIVSRIFAYLRLIEARGVSAWRFDEQRRLNEIGFQFVQKSDAVQYASSIARDLQRFPVQDVLRGHYYQPNYDDDLIFQFLHRLRPDNVAVVVVAKGLETDRVDPWYGTKYAVTPINPETASRWALTPIAAAGLTLPDRNVFIPDDLTVEEGGSVRSVPVRIADAPGYELWHKQDADFRQPRADFFFSVRSPQSNNSPRNAVLTDLFVKVVNDNLTEFSYPALLAGLNYELYTHLRGFTVRISGFDQQQGTLLEKIVAALREPTVDAARFAALKDDLVRSLRNTKETPPYTQAMKEIRNLLLRPYWSIDQRLEALTGVTGDDLVAFVPELLAEIHVVALSHGNVLGSDSLTLGNIVANRLVAHAAPVAIAPGRVIRLAAEHARLRVLAVDHPDSTLAVYYQGDDKTVRSRAQYDLLGKIISAPFYNELRTNKQLGYIVHAGASPLLEVPGLVGLVQSPGTGPAALLDHVDDFIGEFRQSLIELDETVFNQHKHGLISRLTKADERLRTRSDRYWVELDRQHYRFDSREARVRELTTLGLAEFRRFFQQRVTNRNAERLLIISTGTNHAGASPPTETQLIADPLLFDRGKHYFPSSPAEAATSGGSDEVQPTDL